MAQPRTACSTPCLPSAVLPCSASGGRRAGQAQRNSVAAQAGGRMQRSSVAALASASGDQRAALRINCRIARYVGDGSVDVEKVVAMLGINF